MKTKRKIAIASILIVSMLSLTVAGGLLSFYGKIEATASVGQSIVISDDGNTWLDYDTQITRDFGETYGGCCYGYKDWIWNRACVDGTVDITDVGAVQGLDVTHYVLSHEQTLRLENKDANWAIIDDNTWAEITFDTCSKNFVCDINVHGLVPITAYSLIYYADQQDRYTNWGGNPIYVIFGFTTDSNGDYFASHAVTGVPCLPYVDDWNAGPDADYSQAPDNYEHSKGAKLWIVPNSDFTTGGLTAWNPDNYLFETDLIIYCDCDISEPTCDWEYILSYFAMDFPFTIHPDEKLCVFTFYNFAINIIPGSYTVATKFIPVP